MSAVSEPMGCRQAQIGDFKNLRERVLTVMDRMVSLGLCERASCLEWREKLETNAFNLVVVGQFKRGKTCLINALLGAEVLPVSVIPLTSVVTVLVYSETKGAKVFFSNGKTADIPVEAVFDYVTETGNPNNVKGVSEVTVLYPSPYLRGGVRLVDTPGVGSVYAHNTDVAYRFLPRSDAALFLLSVDQPVSHAEVEFLKDVREYAARIFFLLNKTDYLAEEEVHRALTFATATLEEIMGPENIRIFPVSAKLGLRAKQSGSQEELRASGFSLFTGALDRFLARDKGKVLLESVCGNLLKALAQKRLETELKLKSLATPVEQIREKISAFESRKGQLLEERATFDVLFSSELQRFVISELDRGIAEMKKRLTSEMGEQFDAFGESKKELSLKELNDSLEQFVSEKIRERFSAWRELEEERLSGAFDEVCARFAAKVNAMTDSLLNFSSRLFSVPFETVEAESLGASESSFHFKLRGDTVGLDMLTDSLTQIVPAYISGKWKFRRLRQWAIRTADKMIRSKRKRHMLEMIEMQAGRIRSDFLDRLNRSASLFRRRIAGNMDTVAEAIARAIESGIDLGLRGEEEAARIQAGLSEQLAGLELLRSDLARVGEELARQCEK
ncbi:MAG: dynamin family protein [Syntrophobacteraceae bacterium]|nr:dynamin family protein [Syntrophobacteraceae bacterium]